MTNRYPVFSCKEQHGLLLFPEMEDSDFVNALFVLVMRREEKDVITMYIVVKENSTLFCSCLKFRKVDSHLCCIIYYKPD